MSHTDKEIKLELSFEEINLVLKGLGFLPFKDVFELVGKIHDQANEQFRAQQSNTQSTPRNFPDNFLKD